MGEGGVIRLCYIVFGAMAVFGVLGGLSIAFAESAPLGFLLTGFVGLAGLGWVYLNEYSL